jgi:hypothetical protein
MKSLVFVAAALFSLALPAHADWQEYVFPAQGFAVSGPFEPEVAQARSNAGQSGQVVRFDGDQSLFMIGVMKLPAGAQPDAGEVLKGSLAGTLEPVGGQVTSVQAITLDGAPGIDAEFRAPQIHGRYRAYVANGTLYQLSSLAPIDMPVDQDTLKWLVSFRLLR